MPRGRPKGHSPYLEISYEELGDFVGRKCLVKVSRSWLESLRGTISDPVPLTHPKPQEDSFVAEVHTTAPPSEIPQPKIEFNLTTFEDE